MEPRIQCAKTSDGVSIACSAHGECMPLLFLPTPQWGYWHGLLQLPEALAFFLDRG